MSKVLRIVGILFVAFALLGVGVSLAQDKPAAGQDKKETAAAADPLTGDWDGTVDTQNGPVAFTMKLKLEEDKVSGEIASAREGGGTPITGTWADGKFSAKFDYNGAPVAMTGAIKEAEFGGEMSFGGGQAVMKWTAKKK